MEIISLLHATKIVLKEHFQNYIEIKSEPEMKKNLHPERMYFWDKMVWAARERMVEKRLLYVEATQFLLNV